jgi:hypothetical protein
MTKAAIADLPGVLSSTPLSADVGRRYAVAKLIDL